MKSSLAIVVTVLGVCLSGSQAYALSSPSPFVTSTSSAELNQSATDNINGQLPTSSHTAAQGSLSSLTDASSSTSPSDTVVVGPNDATVSLSWDFGEIVDPSLRRLESVSIWLQQDAQRQGFNGSLATSLDGQNYTTIENSLHVDFYGDIPAGTFHNILYDFTGTNVSNFRFIRVDSSGYAAAQGGDTFQPLFVEIDITTSIPEPSTVALLALGAGVLGFSLRKNRKNTE